MVTFAPFKNLQTLEDDKESDLGTCLTWFLASGPAAAQQYAVEGQAGANVKTVYLYNVQNKTTYSTAVANGKFQK